MSPTHYRLVVKGELGARYASAFERMTIFAADGITPITGAIIDQSQLQGLLDRIADLGLTPHGLTPLDTDNGEAAAPPRHPTKSRQAMTERPESSPPDRRCASVGVGRETHISLAGVGKSPPGAQSKEA